MRFSKSLTLPIAVVALLGGCKSDSESSKVAPPAPAPTASGSATVSTGGTTTTIALGSDSATVPASTTTALLALSGGAPVTVSASQNDTSKQDPALLAALGAVPAGATATATWTADFSKVGGIVVSGDPQPIVELNAAAQTISITFPIRGVGRNYNGVVSENQGNIRVVNATVSGNTITFTFSVNSLPIKFMGRELFTSTSVN